MQELIDKLTEALNVARALNAPEQSTRSRELSVAITNLETALLFAREALTPAIH